MRFGVLGPLAVWTDQGRRVPVPDTKVRALLALLLADPGAPLSRDLLIDELWGPRPPRAAAGTLQARVSQLRGALERAEPGGRALVVWRPAGYALDIAPDAVDAGGFADAVTEAGGSAAPAARLAALERALGLWRGQAFADFADQPLLAPVIARLDTLRLGALADRAQARLALGDHEAVLAELAEPQARHPLHERLVGLRMRALYQAGRQDAALAAYQALRTGLAEQLGADPSPELASLHRSLLNHDASLAARPPGNLPARVDELIGRERAIVEVRGTLSTARLVTLTGPGGVGKTRLALAVAEGLAQTFPDGVWLVELAAEGPDTVPDAVAAVLGVRETADSGGAASLPERLAGALAARRALLLLDNCEHLLDAVAALVARLLAAAPELRVLATSREPLSVGGETLRAVPPLELPPAGGVASEEYSAVRLFAARAASAAPGFAVRPDNVETVAAICRRLDGLPLALELAATRVRALEIGELAARLDDRFTLLASGPRDAPARQRTLRAVLDWSWEPLTEPERTVLRRLSVHEDGWSLAAAEAVAAGDWSVLDVLTRLVDRSLVVADPALGRYRLLESVLAYGLARLREAGDEDEARRRHAAYHLALAERAAPLLRGPEQRRWMGVLDAETANLRGALEWAAGAGAADQALRLVDSLAWWWFLRGRHGEARRSLERALAVRGEAGETSRTTALAWYVALSGGVGADAGAGPVERGEEVLRHWATLDDPAGRAYAQWFLSLLTWAYGDPAVHRDRIEEALTTFRALGDRWGEAAALGLRARLAIGDAAWDAMERDARRSLTLFEALGDAWGRLEAGYSLWVVDEIRGEYGAVARRLRDDVAAAEGLGLWTEVASRLSGLGRMALLTGDLPGATRLLERARRLAVESSDRTGQEFAETGLALVARREGRLDAAEELLTTWLRWLDRVEGTAGVAFVQAQLGYVAELRGDHAEALRRHFAGYRAARAVADPRAVALALEGLAGAEAGLGRAARAARLLGAAEAARRAVGAPLPPAERWDVDRAAEAARTALGSAAFAREHAAGAARTPEEALR
ncbi:BTAD domain-containing putative transcriptional regulator [Streptomyces profundus]|uniref:BTAD domain-containing putative transcriptional regulator n=1 Tax=Streptomyces profundus TaxID=2867410 RepID=UPI001D160765|nr:BTAD domain-containing putative transcriptional regulator [Streptomyces sp. MA3_2.13]UED83634.1 winged helix-turn-helix domain-containing protein [Streptomyces sp. MA3_2.13]